MYKKRKKLWERNPHCFWCGIKTVLIIPKRRQKIPSNMATIDHLRSRYDPMRSEPNHNQEERIVLACRKCNCLRSMLETAFLKANNIEKLWALSKRTPKKQGENINCQYHFSPKTETEPSHSNYQKDF